HVHGVAAGARFGDGALQHLFRARTPYAHLHPVFLLVGAHQHPHVVGLRRGVEVELLFLLRSFDQLRKAVGTRIQADVRRGGVRLDLRDSRRGENRARGEQAREKAESRRPHSDSFRIFSPLRKRSDQSFSQRSASSSVITGSIISKGNLLRWVSTARLEGTRLRSFRIVWPSRESMKSAKRSAACGCGARRATPIAFGRPKVGLSAFQRMGAPFTTSRSALWL